jgi:phosphatidylglycerol:prolipoprotein diacylglycerol transferase
MLSLSFFLGGILMLLVAARHGASIYKVAGLIVASQVAALVGSRALFILNRGGTDSLAEAFAISPGGFALNGGVVFAVLTAIIYVRVASLSFWCVSDWSAPSLALGIFVNKMGCFLGGCCYGTPTSLPWGVEFPRGSLAAQNFGLPHLIHPTQIYEGIAGLAILGLILAPRKQSAFEGRVFLLLAMAYMSARFLNDFLRADAVQGYFWGLTQSQFFSLLFGALAGVIYWMRWR